MASAAVSFGNLLGDMSMPNLLNAEPVLALAEGMNATTCMSIDLGMGNSLSIN